VNATAAAHDQARRAGPRLAALAFALAGLPAAGVLLAWSYTLAWRGGGFVHEVFWAAIVVALLSAAGAAALAADPGRLCFWLAVAVAALLSVPKLLRAPVYFSFYDELAHWRAVQQLLEGHALLGENPLNKAVAFYPGLHAVTAAVAAATGWSVFTAGNVVTVGAHCLSGAAVYLLAEQPLGRPRTALLAALVFMANPAFLYFDAQFAYETLALPLACVTVLLAVRLPGTAGRTRSALAGAAGATILAVVVTHHATSYMLAGILVLAAAAAALRRPGRERAAGWPYPVALAGLAAAGALAWTLSVARYTLSYLGPYVASNLASVPSFVRHDESARPLFAGSTLPRYEILGSYLSVLALTGLFAGGLWLLWRDRQERREPAWLVLVPLGALFFASLPLVALRVDQVGKRLWEFAFVGLAPVCALALAALARRARRTGRAGVVAAACLLVVLYVGGVAARSGQHIRFPGPYAPSADPRAMTPDVVAAADWLRRTQGPGNRVMGDRTAPSTMGAYGEQFPVTWHYYGYRTWDVLMPQRLGPGVFAELDRSRTGWVAVDRRAATAPPLTGYYFDEAEPGAFTQRPLAPAALDKFDAAPFERRYDNGHVVLYRYGA
jgi:Family of unknown function (DUF6541)